MQVIRDTISNWTAVFDLRNTGINISHIQLLKSGIAFYNNRPIKSK